MATSIEHFESQVVGFGGDGYSSGVSWGAVIGGAFAAAALSLIMLALGAGFGLSAVSPFSNTGVSAATLGAGAIIWLIITEAVAAALGGYLAGRLRTRWRTIHTDEVHFRDTANGFLVWAVAVVMTVAFLAAGSLTMVGANSEEDLTAGSAQGNTAQAYFVDRLFRSDRGANTAAAPTAATLDIDPLVRSEAARILSRSLVAQTPADTAYLAQMVSARTGLPRTDAERRVSDTIADARQAADDARKATARVLLWTFLALLIGAFCASYAATIGGRQRDHVKLV